MPVFFVRRDFDGDDFAAPLLDQHAVLGELAAHALDVGVRLVDLVDGHDHRHLGGARVIDGFLRLRHDAVVGRDDEDDDVGHLRAAGTHHRERLVARRVEEDDLPAALLDVIRADVLRDAARFAAGDVRLADGVEERGLAVVDVTHDGDDRTARRRAAVAPVFSIASSSTASSNDTISASMPRSLAISSARSPPRGWLIETIEPLLHAEGASSGHWL